jgi:hypothetical protein
VIMGGVASGGGTGAAAPLPPPGREDCLSCRLVGVATCLGLAAWVSLPQAGAPAAAPRGVRLAAAAVLVGMGVARAVV